MIELSLIAIVLSLPLLIYSCIWILRNRDMSRRFLKLLITGKYEPPGKKQLKEKEISKTFNLAVILWLSLLMNVIQNTVAELDWFIENNLLFFIPFQYVALAMIFLTLFDETKFKLRKARWRRRAKKTEEEGDK